MKRNSEIRTIPLTKVKTEFQIPEIETPNQDIKPEPIELTGTLSFADSKKSTIKLTDSNNTDYKIFVPKGLLSDVVKPYFEEEVVIRGVEKEGIIELIDVNINE